MPQLRDRIRPLGRRISSITSKHRWTLLALAAILSTTLTIPFVVRSLEPGDRITIGNTAGMLTALIEINSQRILVGAGPTRAHAADLVGRSTRPWNREIDLLIVPGWDDSHAVGALGLLERRSVLAIAVLGVPGNEPIWSMLERQSRDNDIPMRYLPVAHQLDLGANTSLRMAELEHGEGAWLRLDYNGIRIDLVDAEDTESIAPPATRFEHRNDHVLVNMRTQRAPAFTTPELLIHPRPFYRDEFENADARFVHEIDRSNRIRLELAEGEIRTPLDEIDR